MLFQTCMIFYVMKKSLSMQWKSNVVQNNIGPIFFWSTEVRKSGSKWLESESIMTEFSFLYVNFPFRNACLT